MLPVSQEENTVEKGKMILPDKKLLNKSLKSTYLEVLFLLAVRFFLLEGMLLLFAVVVCYWHNTLIF